MLTKGVKMEWNDLNLENKFKTFRAYQQSKLANVLFSMELSKRYQGYYCLLLFIIGVFMLKLCFYKFDYFYQFF